MSAEFQASAAEVETIFDSYRTLHTVYSTSLKTLSKELDGLPASYRQVVERKKTMFGDLIGTVKTKQSEISNQLYSQGLVLLVGNAEALTREMFRTLLAKNIRALNLTKDIVLPLSKVLEARDDEELGELVLSILEDERNPAEKLNFQNMKQLQGIMKSYLQMEISDDYIKDLHEFWQIRHIVIHNSGVIDEKFVHNLKAAGISTGKYALSTSVSVKKADYERCFGLLVLLFEEFDKEISRLGLEYTVD